MNAAYLDSLLNGVPLPASKDELIDYARRQAAGDRAADRLRALPEREYRSLDEVVEELEPRQPRAWREPPPTELPKPESGVPPGGAAYVGKEQEPANVAAAREV